MGNESRQSTLWCVTGQTLRSTRTYFVPACNHSNTQKKSSYQLLVIFFSCLHTFFLSTSFTNSILRSQNPCFWSPMVRWQSCVFCTQYAHVFPLECACKYRNVLLSMNQIMRILRYMFPPYGKLMHVSSSSISRYGFIFLIYIDVGILDSFYDWTGCAENLSNGTHPSMKAWGIYFFPREVPPAHVTFVADEGSTFNWKRTGKGNIMCVSTSHHVPLCCLLWIWGGWTGWH